MNISQRGREANATQLCVTPTVCLPCFYVCEVAQTRPFVFPPRPDVGVFSREGAERTLRACRNLFIAHLRTAAQADAAPHGLGDKHTQTKERQTEVAEQQTARKLELSVGRISFPPAHKGPRAAAELRASMMHHNSERAAQVAANAAQRGSEAAGPDRTGPDGTREETAKRFYTF